MTLDQLQAAMRAVWEDESEPAVLVLHPATYQALEWELRRTKIDVTYTLLPGVRLARRAARTARRWRTRLRWWRLDRQERKGR